MNRMLDARRKGAAVRNERLTPDRRSEIASHAAQARWNREAPGVNLARIEGLQMSTDAIEAADILLTELSEQAAHLSESGVQALSNGHLAEAKLIINAIEKTHGLRDRVEQIKAEIAVLHSTLTPAEDRDEEDIDLAIPADVDSATRKQDRTDPVLMNKKKDEILRELESGHGVRLNRRSAAIYRSDNNEVGIVCAMSKWHAKNENYWYAFHSHQDEFLQRTRQGYFVLGMMDSEVALSLPIQVVRDNLSKLNTTTTPDRRTYWHIHVSPSRDGGFSLQRARGEPPLVLDRYVVKLRA
jgi:hypothetical protein